MFETLGTRDLKRFEELLEEAVEAAKDLDERQKVEKLRQYLKANWDGLVDWRQRPGPQPEGAKSLGAIEGQVRHIAAARMKRRGASWTKRGANNMLQLRLLGEMDRLGSWLCSWQNQRWPEVTERASQLTAKEVVKRLAGVNSGEWLRASLPLLGTKYRFSPLEEALYKLSHTLSLEAC